MAIADGERIAVEKAKTVRLALIAELTWAKLYTKSMCKDLGTISTAIRKSQSIAAGPELKESADKLHDQLQSANRTLGEIGSQAAPPLSVPVTK